MIKDYKLYLGDNVEVMKKEIEDDVWIECYHVFINCPYCGESIEVIKQDWYNKIEKCKCNKCGKTFKLKTNNFIGAI